MLHVVEALPVEVEGQEAPGAIPNGTRVRKAFADPDDQLKAGHLGTVRGSVATPAEIAEEWRSPFCYYIEWDGWEGVRFAVRSAKVERDG